VASIDGVVRQLAQQRLDEPILAIAQFRVAGPELRWWTPLAVVVAQVPDWVARRHQARLPTPAFVSITESSVVVFSARFGRTTRVIGPVRVWPRAQVTAVPGDAPFMVTVRPGPESVQIELDASDPGPDAASVIRLLCSADASAPDR
jgi:hypothetical protein